MNFSTEQPPNIEKIKKVLTPHENTVFCYGDTVYGKTVHSLDSSFVAHEATHFKQQDGNPEGWWDRYLADPAFRLSQELEAYQVQHYFNKKNIKQRDQVALRLHHMAQALSGSTYQVGITMEQAKRFINIH